MQLILVLIPCLTGLLGLLNDIEGASSALSSTITPLLSMQNVEPEFLHSWRAIHAPLFQKIVYVLMFSAEGVVGLLSAIGLFRMLSYFNAGHEEFIAAQAWARVACLLGFIIWGLGFFVIGGDFFLSWQNNSLSFLQQGGLNYALMMVICYFLMKNFAITKFI